MLSPKVTHFCNIFYSCKSIWRKSSTCTQSWLLNASIISNFTLVMFVHYLRIHWHLKVTLFSSQKCTWLWKEQVLVALIFFSAVCWETTFILTLSFVWKFLYQLSGNLSHQQMKTVNQNLILFTERHIYIYSYQYKCEVIFASTQNSWSKDKFRWCCKLLLVFTIWNIYYYCYYSNT